MDCTACIMRSTPGKCITASSAHDNDVISVDLVVTWTMPPSRGLVKIRFNQDQGTYCEGAGSVLYCSESLAVPLVGFQDALFAPWRAESKCTTLSHSQRRATWVCLHGSDE